MLTTPFLVAFIMNNSCSWCHSAQWQFKCSTCDPRREKTLCRSCCMLWHTRGFASCHQLTNVHGEIRSFIAWMTPQQTEADIRNGSLETEAKAATNGSRTVPNHTRAQEGAIGQVEEGIARSVPANSLVKNNVGDAITDGQQMRETQRFELAGCSAFSSAKENAPSAEKNDREERPKPSALSELESKTAAKSPHRITERQSEASDHMDRDDNVLVSTVPDADASSPPTISSPCAGTSPSVQSQEARTAVPIATSAPTLTSDVENALMPRKPIHAASNTLAEKTSNLTLLSKTLDLEKLLRWFPTTDQVLIEMLAMRVEQALAIEDALICARIGKCQESTCRSVLLHYEHCKRNEVCHDAKCTEISIVYWHRRTCAKKYAAAERHGTKIVCPFCIRIRQRRSVGVVVALDHLISDQRRKLLESHSESTGNFCLQIINALRQRTLFLRDEIDQLNQLASESCTPVFNFPSYQWHFRDAASIKREPSPLETQLVLTTHHTSERDGTEQANLARAENEDNIVREAQTQVRDDSVQDDTMPGNVNFNADYINELLRAKAVVGDDREAAQREFDGVLELGCAIVDASFCAPSKAQRCLLNCKSILVHLQHHLDLQVCKQAMCAAVEHHFGHLSQCKARNESDSCEYCLRVEERQLLRSIDFMEVERPEAEAKVQKIINDITVSFTNHGSHEQREQEVILLEDELDQAENNKHELLEKLNVARINLQSVQRIMERNRTPTSSSHHLPVHFTKVRRAGSNNKKRRLGGIT
ncbi:hypothetical protein PsorP6_008141 [Peronosclerospora sorghi]|uniref:Uncharacterized protein n=1 Tax=Peronosclerospora sorghi TaxID=230839 RepID=A0ACC0WAY8_9STRA|nr:hypothetical protein PsorP6_008141 [Peronosclerospora sorghi]